MDWLNYHHLLYFWTVVREGGVSPAARRLRLSQPTVSAQIRKLEGALDEQLFERKGRRLVLTDVGRVVYRYADELFAIGRELQETLKGRPSGRPRLLTVGIANEVPKLIVHRLLRPALQGTEPMHLICREDNPERLVAQLATHALDLVISAAPAPPYVRVRVFSHILGESGMTFFARAPLSGRLRRRFPRSLSGAPLLVPTAATATRRGLEQWFESTDLHPRIVAEFDDAALMNAFGEAGTGAFVGPTAIEREVCRYYGVQIVGRIEDVRERYYAISAERRLKHPGVLAITESARTVLRH